jgi:pyrimidine dimer DNA glycosylase
MRLWTLHPRYLDAKGLVAVWREGLLARAVLRGKTRGYRHHPQLIRFQESSSPVATLNRYLSAIHREASRRGYAFDASRFGPVRGAGRLTETRGQLDYEWDHLLAKLRRRAPEQWRALQELPRPEPHPLFRIVSGKVAAWEVGAVGAVRAVRQ